MTRIAALFRASSMLGLNVAPRTSTFASRLGRSWALSSREMRAAVKNGISRFVSAASSMNFVWKSYSRAFHER
jgi:hypothetical protein